MSLAPFAGAAILAWLTMLAGTGIEWPAFAASTGLLAIAGVLAHRGSRSDRMVRFGQLPGCLTFLLAVAILRGAAGITSGVAGLSMIPVFYAALAGSSRRQLCGVLVGVAAFYLVPILVIGPPAYPHSQYRAALLSVLMSSIVGLATQSLVSRIKSQAAEAGRRERMLEQVGQVVHGLFDSRDPRREVCESARAISDATVAVLFESDESGALTSTAMAGLDVPPVTLRPLLGSPVQEAARTGRPRLLTGDMTTATALPELWDAAGCPDSVLIQPLLKDGRVSGILVVGWPAELAVSGSRATVVALLAHEAAVAISRSDQLRRLTGMAQTDPLTGLPNRRAWDARLARAARNGEEFVAAMLDLDHFKRFNDTFGHPAGDRLLKETAAVWRDQLRVGDLLARLGGEEFGLLLFDCDLGAATEVTERLRRLVTGEQTCSVGLALRRDEEPCDDVLSRADQALYEAKAAGRDRACAAA
ncbi:MAG: sensor domain-containing diguanylate cyclase [Solirubrobacteraceae bacterium]